MKDIEWSTYKFHCSGLRNLMVTSRKKSDPLSETTKAYLREIYIDEVWGRKKTDMLANKYTQKGIECETDSISLLEKVRKTSYFKNQKQLENEFIIGTPDIIEPQLVDVKTSWDIFTFAAVDEEKAKKDYFYQLLGYMWLTGKETSLLAYCLVDTPDQMANDDMCRLSFKLPEEELETYRNNYKYGDIPEEMRVKQYEFETDMQTIEALILKIQASREYLQTIHI